MIKNVIIIIVLFLLIFSFSCHTKDSDEKTYKLKSYSLEVIYSGIVADTYSGNDVNKNTKEKYLNSFKIKFADSDTSNYVLLTNSNTKFIRQFNEANISIPFYDKEIEKNEDKFSEINEDIKNVNNSIDDEIVNKWDNTFFKPDKAIDSLNNITILNKRLSSIEKNTLVLMYSSKDTFTFSDSKQKKYKVFNDWDSIMYCRDTFVCNTKISNPKVRIFIDVLDTSKKITPPTTQPQPPTPTIKEKNKVEEKMKDRKRDKVATDNVSGISGGNEKSKVDININIKTPKGNEESVKDKVIKVCYNQGTHKLIWNTGNINEFRIILKLGTNVITSTNTSEKAFDIYDFCNDMGIGYQYNVTIQAKDNDKISSYPIRFFRDTKTNENNKKDIRVTECQTTLGNICN